ncbi:MAG: prepilin-type N-terminal cleavage/methylation domain-containing protein [Candidatus Paceibacterota bacterium]
MKKEKGFTLIEILIVVAIIGLLASVVLVGLGSFRSRGRDARRVADLREVQNSLELYYLKNGNYPASNDWADLKSVLVNDAIGITNIPNDPLSDSSSATYLYGYSADKQGYVLGATLEDVNNSALKDDIDGTVYGVGCMDSVYCVQF